MGQSWKMSRDFLFWVIFWGQLFLMSLAIFFATMGISKYNRNKAIATPNDKEITMDKWIVGSRNWITAYQMTTQEPDNVVVSMISSSDDGLSLYANFSIKTIMPIQMMENGKPTRRAYSISMKAPSILYISGDTICMIPAQYATPMVQQIIEAIIRCPKISAISFIGSIKILNKNTK